MNCLFKSFFSKLVLVAVLVFLESVVFAQQRKEVKGKVVNNSNKEPLMGVSVKVQGSGIGTATDRNGEFAVRVSDNDSLEFTNIGFEKQEVFVGNQLYFQISLKELSTSLNDVVVIGYGTQKKRDVTGAVASISSKNFDNQPITGLDQAMAGQAAGVQVSQRSATPGGGVSVQVRGTGSIGAGNEPLYVIDGFPVETGFNRDISPLSTINPNDIESIEVLKDASSAAIYGSRGSNGVVIITTKKGKAGKGKIQLDAYYGVQQVAHKIDMLNASEYAAYNTEARNNGWVDAGGKATDPNSVRPPKFQIPPGYENPGSLGTGTDWQNEIFRSAPMANYQLTFSGGNNNSQYLVSANYLNQQGIVLNTGFKRYSFRVNLNSKVTDKLSFGLNLTPSYSQTSERTVEDQAWGQGILASALGLPPSLPVRNPDGTFTTQLGNPPYNMGVLDNPVAIAEKQQKGTSAVRTLGTIFAEYEIVKNLKFKTSFGADYFENRYSFFSPSTLGRTGLPAPQIPIASASSMRELTWLNENTINYNSTFHNHHHINAVAGFVSQKDSYQNYYLNAINFPNDLVTTLNAGQIQSGGTYKAEWSLLSYLGRINYNYASKYLFTATVRRDGSSRFGAGRRWGTFPSIAAGWNVAQEDFLKNNSLISDLKLRASYGHTGNNAIGNYSAIGSLAGTRYVFGAGTGEVVNGLAMSGLSNQDLGWEVMKQLDLGIEVSLFRQRVYLTVDYYNKNTSGLLLNVPVPASTGFSTALENIGKVNNKGWEFALSTKNTVGNFRWTTNLNFSVNKNKVLALGPSGDPIITRSPGFAPMTHITQIGLPLASFYGYKVIGIYKDQQDVDKSAKVEGGAASHPGDLKFEDVNGDGKITPADLTVIGKNQPDYTYGITNNISFKNFSLSVLIDGVQGVQVLNGGRRNISLITGSYSRRDVLGRWQSPQQPGDGKTPRANVAPTGGNVSFASSYLIEDASFTRIRNINLSYLIPDKVLNKKGISNATIFISVQNAFTFTPYKGYNPEQNLNGGSALTPGVDFNGYPVARVFTAGFNVTF